MGVSKNFVSFHPCLLVRLMQKHFSLFLFFRQRVKLNLEKSITCFSENISRLTDIQKNVWEVLTLKSVSVIRVRVLIKLVLPKEGGVDVLLVVQIRPGEPSNIPTLCAVEVCQ